MHLILCILFILIDNFIYNSLLDSRPKFSLVICYVILVYSKLIDILHYIILYYIVLTYVELYYIILCFIILYYIILYYTILYYIILYYIILYIIMKYYMMLYCAIFYYIVYYIFYHFLIYMRTELRVIGISNFILEMAIKVYEFSARLGGGAL